MGDLNGDGKPDLATATIFDGVSILLGDGSGAFGAASNFATGLNSESVAIGDLNGDGKPDLAVANVNSDNVSVLLGSGTGAFGTATNFTVGSYPQFVAMGDLNGDGKPDLRHGESGQQQRLGPVGQRDRHLQPGHQLRRGWGPGLRRRRGPQP